MDISKRRGIKFKVLKTSWQMPALLIVVLFLLVVGCRQSGSSTVLSPPQEARSQATPASTSKSKGYAVRSEIGFATRQKFLDHFAKHGSEFGSISKDVYLRMAQELRDRPAGGDVLESVRADGVITRFDKKSGAFLAFNSDLTIRTYFIPNDGEAYFRRQSKRAAAASGRSRDE